MYLEYVYKNINEQNATSLEKFQEVFEVIIETEKQQTAHALTSNMTSLLQGKQQIELCLQMIL